MPTSTYYIDTPLFGRDDAAAAILCPNCGGRMRVRGVETIGKFYAHEDEGELMVDVGPQEVLRAVSLYCVCEADDAQQH